MKIRKIGEEVIHKASGEKGVILWVHKQCLNESHTKGIHCLGHKDCDMHPIDRYDISTGFEKVVEDVDGFVLV